MTASRPLPRLLIADDHRLILEAFEHLIERVATVVGTAADGHTLLRLASDLTPDVVVTDLSMPGMNGIEVTRSLSALVSAPRVIILTIHADPALARAAFAAGAFGYVVKSADSVELREAITTVMRGTRYLSPGLSVETTAVERADPLAVLTAREHQVLTLLAAGHTARAVADRLGISERTVNFHKMNLKARLGVATITEAVAWLSRHAPSVPGV
ncbi:MAG: response regulator transcription factor [Gemmatimonadota bacterium]|nr:response regulator transcription factor [Gemmatimonadota bacterium]